MEEFQRLEARAEEDLRKALDFAPKHPSLNTSLLTIGRSLGKPVAELRERRDAALEGCRRCYLPHRDYMLALLPRWGGSYEQMQAEVERLRPRFEEDPKLKVLEGLIAWDQCNAEASAETKKQCDTAVAIARDTRYLHQRAEYFMATKEWDAALADLDALLAFWPQYQEGVRDRAQVHFELQNQEKALIDLLLLRQLDPGDGKTAKRVAEILDWLPGYVHKLNNEGRAGEAKRLMEIGAKLDPDNQQLLNAGGHVDAKLGIDELVAAAKANPDDFDKIRAADYALAAKRRYAEVVELWDDYLSRHPQDGKAYLERAGAHHHLQQEPQAIADLEKSCDLRVVDACRLLERMGR
jgi:regulator of sirC expression with transglutaminase-like and TPR domain